MGQKNKILELLIKNKIDNINIINFIENYSIFYLEQIGDSVIVKGTSDRNWVYISSKSEEELKIIKSRLDYKDKNFAIIEDWMIPILTKGNKIKWRLSTMKLVISNIKVIAESKHSVSKLAVCDSKFIYENSNYKDFISMPYIIERITNGVSSCIRYMDKLIAWGITQDDGAIGFLHVLPEYRKRGYARDVMIDLINKVRDENKIPFVHIEEGNEKSMKLAMSLGFEKDRVVSWFEIE
ncbi:GNAT family N-acetyltransferase [Clostridium estertheticum]|uniref:GNAT family N-acetyltransferase n=1 Tax=Clostridium estertheticum TaxID=238834 RepID=UPI00209B4504|nr:GNAT family N-acetyltransferase [Clostridium estertheticum]